MSARDYPGYYANRERLAAYLEARDYDTRAMSAYGLTAEGYWRILRDESGAIMRDGDTLQQKFTHWKSPTHGEWVLRTIQETIAGE